MSLLDEFVSLAPELHEIDGGYHVKTTEDGEFCIDIMQMMTNWRVILSRPNHVTYVHGWCYFGHGEAAGVPRNMSTALLAALLAAVAWDGTGEPQGYDKQAC